MKLPFNLDFDEFEDRFPEIRNQRFYGFKKLALLNAFLDKSLMRFV
ncbi:CotH kinase family protein [Thermodesulfobacteriota bacterium]